MKNPGFLPNKGRYLVLPNPVESQTTKIEGSQYTIESQKDIHAKPSEGTVIAKGSECTEYEPGAKVLYGKFSGYEQLFDGTNYLILAETELLGERLVTPFDDDLGVPASPDLKFIGDVRRSMFTAYDSKWNGYIRDLTAELEVNEMVSVSALQERIFADSARAMGVADFLLPVEQEPKP